MGSNVTVLEDTVERRRTPSRALVTVTLRTTHLPPSLVTSPAASAPTVYAPVIKQQAGYQDGRERETNNILTAGIGVTDLELASIPFLNVLSIGVFYEAE